jgi:hypothetical protein
MPLSVASKMRSLAADGYFGKKDLQDTVTDMLDGRGITKTEKKRFVDQFEALVEDKNVKVTEQAQDAFDHLKGRMRGYSRTKEVFAPSLDETEVKDILSLYVDRSRSYGGGEYGGGRSSSTRPTPSPVRYSGGE